MDRGVKLMLTAVVLLGGMVGALAWRHRGSPSAPPATEAASPLVLRQQTAVAPRMPSQPNRGGLVAAPRSPATIPTRLEEDTPPPELARLYPQPDEAAVAATLRPAGTPDPGSPRDRPTTRLHKVVDGDTLPELARRYLGSPTRWPEIFEANRSLLASPEVLPIGASLRIPSRLVSVPAEPSPPTPAPPPRRRPLVPVDAPETSPSREIPPWNQEPNP